MHILQLVEKLKQDTLLHSILKDTQKTKNQK